MRYYDDFWRCVCLDYGCRLADNNCALECLKEPTVLEKDGNIYAAGVQAASAKLETVSARKQERFTDVGLNGGEIVPGSLVLERRMRSKLLQVAIE